MWQTKELWERFLEVWQGKDLASDFADVRQIKNLVTGDLCMGAREGASEGGLGGDAGRMTIHVGQK